MIIGPRPISWAWRSSEEAHYNTWAGRLSDRDQNYQYSDSNRVIRLAAPRPWRQAKAGVSYKVPSSSESEDEFEDVDSSFNQTLEEDYSIETQFQLMCNLRTINSEFDQTNFSVIPSLGTVSLSIQCAEIINQESKLLNHSFQHLHQLEDLSIKHCKLGFQPWEPKSTI